MNAEPILHFLDLAFQAEEQEFLPITVGYVHSFNARHENALGVDFPGWEPESSFSRASTLRVLGTAEALHAFILQTKVSRLASLCGLSLKVCAVPVTAELVCVTRDNRSDKAKPSYGRRIARRAAARAGVEVTTFDPRRRQKIEVSVSLTSASNKHSFRLRVKKRAVQSSDAVKFNAFGLCIQGGIPQF